MERKVFPDLIVNLSKLQGPGAYLNGASPWQEAFLGYLYSRDALWPLLGVFQVQGLGADAPLFDCVLKEAACGQVLPTGCEMLVRPPWPWLVLDLLPAGRHCSSPS